MKSPKNVAAARSEAAAQEVREPKRSQQRHDVLGRELLDDTPVATSLRTPRPVTIAEQTARLRQAIRVELSAAAEAQGTETFAEANDFEIPEDPADPMTPYEIDADNYYAAVEELERQELEQPQGRQGDPAGPTGGEGTAKPNPSPETLKGPAAEGGGKEPAKPA